MDRITILEKQLNQVLQQLKDTQDQLTVTQNEITRLKVQVTSLTGNNNATSGRMSFLKRSITFIVIYLLSLMLTVIFIFTILNSLGTISGSITAIVSGIGGLLILIAPSLSISGISSYLASKWRHIGKILSRVLVIFVVTTDVLLTILLWSYLGPTTSINAPFPQCPPLRLSYPAPLANNKYTTPQQLYYKVTCGASTDYSLVTGQNNDGWDNGKKYPNCVFTNKGYKVTSNTKSSGPFHDGVQPCFFHKLPLSDFAYQVDIAFVNTNNQGGGGLVFRAPDPPSYQDSGIQTMYRLGVTPTGNYNFFLTVNEICNRKGADITKIYLYCVAPMAKTGVMMWNTVTVICIGSKIYLYINGDYVDQSSNDISDSGYIGLFANANNGPSIVLFKHARLWKLWL